MDLSTAPTDVLRCIVMASGKWKTLALVCRRFNKIARSCAFELRVSRWPHKSPQALKDFTNLTWLSMERISNSNHAVSTALDCLGHQLVSLDVGYNQDFTDTRLFSRMTRLQHLSLTYCRGLETGALRPLQTLTGLRCLNLGHVQKDQCIVMEEVMGFLAPLRQLEYLILAWNRQSSHRGWQHLSSNLRYLDAVHNHNIASFETLSHLTRLRVLNVGHIEGRQAVSLCGLSSLKALRLLIIRASPGLVQDSLLPSLRALKQLHLIDVDSMGLDDISRWPLPCTTADWILLPSEHVCACHAAWATGLFVPPSFHNNWPFQVQVPRRDLLESEEVAIHTPWGLSTAIGLIKSVW
jgi:hypothetical protein